MRPKKYNTEEERKEASRIAQLLNGSAKNKEYKGQDITQKIKKL